MFSNGIPEEGCRFLPAWRQDVSHVWRLPTWNRCPHAIRVYNITCWERESSWELSKFIKWLCEYSVMFNGFSTLILPNITKHSFKHLQPQNLEDIFLPAVEFLSKKIQALLRAVERSGFVTILLEPQRMKCILALMRVYRIVSILSMRRCGSG